MSLAPRSTTDPLDCPDCKDAAERPHHGFHAGCSGCRARSAARTPHYRRARESGVQDRPYRLLLHQFDLTHEQVRAAAAADFASREGTAIESQSTVPPPARCGDNHQEGKSP